MDRFLVLVWGFLCIFCIFVYTKEDIWQGTYYQKIAEVCYCVMLWKATEVERGKTDKNRQKERQFTRNIIQDLDKNLFFALLRFVSYGTFYTVFISQYGTRSVS